MLTQFTVVTGAVDADAVFTIPVTFPDIGKLIQVTRVTNALGASALPVNETIIADATANPGAGEISLQTSRTWRSGTACTTSTAFVVLAQVVGGRNVAVA